MDSEIKRLLKKYPSASDLILNILLVAKGARRGALLEFPKKDKGLYHDLHVLMIDKLKLDTTLSSHNNKYVFEVISEKKLPTGAHKWNDKQLGEFLGFMCATNDLISMKDNRIIAEVIVSKGKITMCTITEVCPLNTDVKKIVRHWLKPGKKIQQALKGYPFTVYLRIKVQRKGKYSKSVMILLK